MGEFLLVQQVEALFPDEWVLLGDVTYDQKNQVVGGIVLFHGPSREGMYQAAVKLKPKRSATVPPTNIDLDTVFMF